MQGDACITLTTTQHLHRRAVNGAKGKARRPLTAKAQVLKSRLVTTSVR